MYLDRGLPADEGHEHHLRAINTIRRCGGIRAAVDKGLLKSGIITGVHGRTDGFTINDSSSSIPIHCTAEKLPWAAPESISTDQLATVLGPLVNKTYVAERIILNSARR